MTVPDIYRVEMLIDRTTTQWPDALALCFGARRWTYAQLCAARDRRAALMVAAGLRPGAVVATTEPVTDDTAIAFLACCRADLVFLPLPPNLTPAEMTALLHAADAQLVLTAHGEPHPAHPAIPALPLDLPGRADAAGAHEVARRAALARADATAMIQTTSGTTGSRPKLVAMTHRALVWHRLRGSWWARAGDVTYRPGALYFPVRDLCELLGAGAALVLSHALYPEQIEAELRAHRATGMVTFPAVLRLLGEQRRPPLADLALRVISFTAAPLAPDVQRAVRGRYRVPVFQAYGSTEGGSLIRVPDEATPEGSIGVPYRGVDARLVDVQGKDVARGDVGELVVRSPGVMTGYLGDPLATAEALHDGWLWTGDLAWQDGEGYYYLAGRRALRINVGGLKVTPEEVEAVLESHAGVREAVVMGVADAGRGEVVRAVIVAAKGSPAPTVGELRRWCRERLAGYKVPRQWEYREELPRSAQGKVLRHLL